MSIVRKSGGACYIYLNPDRRPSECVYKIGKANDVKSRHQDLSTSYLDDIVDPWYIYPTDPMECTGGVLRFIETVAHGFFADIRIKKNKEYFRLMNVNDQLANLISHIIQIGYAVRLTRNIADLANVYDYSEDIVVQVPSSATLAPYPHQIAIMDRLTEWYRSSHISGKLILPPGIGKSYISAFHIKNAAIQKVLILVPLKAIADDFCSALTRCGLAGIKKIYDKSGNVLQDIDGIQVVVNDTARNDMARNAALQSAKFDLIIYDEAHHMCSKDNRALLEIRAGKRLFLTATELLMPDHPDEFDMTHEKFGKEIYRMTVSQAIQKGLLCDYKIFLTDWDKGIVAMVKQLVDVYHRKKIIMFANETAAAKDAAELLTANGFLASHIHAGTSDVDRAKIRKTFEESPLGIICNVRVIGEGVNIPCIDTIVFLDSRTSNIGVIQNIGRGLRIHKTPTHTKDFCMVAVTEEMIKEEFVRTLTTYDSRMYNPAPMVIQSSGHTAKLPPGSMYSVDGMVKFIEHYCSERAKKKEEFISRIRSMDIYNETDYHRKFAANYSEAFPSHPVQEYDGFNWGLVPHVSFNTYTTIEECRSVIGEIIKDADITAQLMAIPSSSDRLKLLMQIDSRIPIDAIKKYKLNRIQDLHRALNTDRVASR